MTMKTLGIFGDSYADTSHGHKVRDPYDLYIDKSWVNMLKNDYIVTTHGKSGSSIYYSYKLLLEHYTKYDKIIWIVTEPWRIHDNVIDKRHVAAGLAGCELMRKDNIIAKLDQEAMDKFIAIEHYYKYLQNDTIDLDIARLMVGESKRVKDDIVLVPMCRTDLFKGQISLCDYYNAQFETLASKKIQWNEVIEIGCYCHLTEEYNQILYEEMIKTLDRGSWNPLSVPRKKHERGFEWYFKSRET